MIFIDIAMDTLPHAREQTIFVDRYMGIWHFECVPLCRHELITHTVREQGARGPGAAVPGISLGSIYMVLPQ